MTLRKLSEDLKMHIVENDKLCDDKARLEAEVGGGGAATTALTTTTTTTPPPPSFVSWC
jgi:hypothetical protein